MLSPLCLRQFSKADILRQTKGILVMRVCCAVLVFICSLAGLVDHDVCVAQDSNGEFEELFNGTDLKGWYGLKTIDPRKWNALSDQGRADLREKASAGTSEHWSVENGEIVNDGKGPFLVTEREFGDYEMELEYRTVALAESGVYLKGTPQVQIWDFTKAGGKWNIGADKGSGGLWNNRKGMAGKDPLVLADKPFGEWNKLRVLQVGARTTVHLNGKLVVDHATMDNFWDRKQPLIQKGPIQLQTHGGEIRWRNIRARDLKPAEANKILASHGSDGFEPIFNGKDFSGWQGATDDYQVVDGALMCKPGKGGNLFTEKEYSDFKVRFEFKLPPKGNNGLAVRYPGEGDPAYAGMCELQVLNADYPGELDYRQFHGSAYGMAAAAKGYLRSTGEWNFQEVTVAGSKIKVELNGSIILDCDLSEVSDYLGDRPHPGKDRKSGYFGFAGHNDPVQFRNITAAKVTQEP